MTEPNENVSLNLFDAIDSICSRFRSQLKSNKRPRIEDWISQISEKARPQLFRNLLDLEIKQRTRQKETPTSQEYLKRFPNFSQHIRQVFDESTIGSIEDLANGMADNDSAEAPTQTLVAPGAGRLGDYELLRELGRGGFGVVYDAGHSKRNNRVALKTLPTGHDGQEVNADRLHKFRKEFRSLSEINHPNLVGMQTLEVDGDQWFFTMDLIEGTDFLSYVRPNDVLDEAKLRVSLDQLARGIIALHELGIVHRDLKPSNVMVEADGTVKILDFGLVAQLQTATDLTVSRSGMFAGTPKYASPEQMFGERSEASDWYAFGTMLYEAITGGPPFTGPAMEVLRRKQTEDPPVISGNEFLPVDLSQLADDLVKRVPSERPITGQIIELLKLDLETRTHGTTQGSSGSTGSVDAEEPLLRTAVDEDIVLVGREDQMAQLEAIQRDFLQSPQPTVVWISGKSGEGKSSLAEKFLRPIRLGDEMLVLSGRCYDRESVPFKAIDSTLEPLATFLRNNAPADMDKLISSNTQLLLQTFPLLRRVKMLANAPQPDVRGVDNRQLQLRAFDALKDLWAGVGRQTPVVLFVDDLQWGDADSAERLWEIFAENVSLPVLLLGSFRSDETEQSPFLNKWRDLQKKSKSGLPTHEVQVQPLDSEQCLKLLGKWSGQDGDHLEPSLVHLIEESAGNPFLLELLFDSLQIRGDQSSLTGLAELLQQRLTRLAKEAKPLLDAIAVAGQASLIEELVAAAQLKDQPLSLLTHMRSEKLVRLIGARDDLRVDTYHDKIRETALEQMDPAHRRSIHLRLAEFIENQESPKRDEMDGLTEEQSFHPRLFDLAYHFTEANDPRAFQYLLAAGQRALLTAAVEEALEYFKQAEQRLPESVDATTRFQLMQGLAQVNYLIGQIDHSRKLFDEASKLAQTPLDRARCQYGIGRGWLRQGDLVNANELFKQALQLMRESQPRTMLGKILRIAVSLFQFWIVPRWMSFRGQRLEHSERELFLAEIGVEITRSFQTDFQAMAAYQTREGANAKFSSNADRWAWGQLLFANFFAINGLGYFASRQLSILEDRLSNIRSEHLRVYMNFAIGEGQYFLGHLELAEDHFHKSKDELRTMRDYHEGYTYHYLRHIASIRGRTERICAWGKRELDYSAKNQDKVTAALGEYGLADGLARSGQFDQAILLARQAGKVLRECQSQTCLIADQELGRALMQASRYDEAREILKPAQKFVASKFLFAELTLDIYPLLTEAILATHWIPGDEAADRQVIRNGQRMARKSRFHCLKFPTLKPHSLRVSGRAATAAGKLKKAIGYFDKGIVAAEKIGAHYEHARCLIDKSLLNYPEAQSDQQRGVELLESLGSVLPEAEVEYLNLDRDEHHAHAAVARLRDRNENDFPEFNLENWKG